MSLEAREQALLDLVHRYREAECKQILQAAAGEVHQTLARAHRDARRNLHQAVLNERRRAQTEIQAAQAERDTQRRMYRQRRYALLLETVWQHLEPELLRRWQAEPERGIWIREALRKAAEVLPGKQWTIRHPPGWSVREAQQTLTSLGVEASWQADPEVRAGIVISADGASLDTSLEALLAAPEAIKARALTLLPRDHQP